MLACGVLLTVALTSTFELMPVQVTVLDDGPGAPRDMRARVFGWLETLHPRDVIESAGVGLALVRKIARSRRSGPILTSPLADGRGGAVTFSWPLRPI